MFLFTNSLRGKRTWTPQTIIWPTRHHLAERNVSAFIGVLRTLRRLKDHPHELHVKFLAGVGEWAGLSCVDVKLGDFFFFFLVTSGEEMHTALEWGNYIKKTHLLSFTPTTWTRAALSTARGFCSPLLRTFVTKHNTVLYIVGLSRLWANFLWVVC